MDVKRSKTETRQIHVENTKSQQKKGKQKGGGLSSYKLYKTSINENSPEGNLSDGSSQRAIFILDQTLNFFFNYVEALKFSKTGGE